LESRVNSPDPVSGSLLAANAASSVAKDSGGLLLRSLGPSADVIGEELAKRTRSFFNRNGARTVLDAQRLIAEAKVQEAPVPEKLLIPLIMGASQEGDAYLATKWAGLLASAGTDYLQASVHPAFAKILSELTANEALLLDELAARGGAAPWSGFKTEFAREFGDEAVGAMHNNLFRLHLWATSSSEMNPVSMVKVTAFGTAFLKAVQGPMPSG